MTRASNHPRTSKLYCISGSGSTQKDPSIDILHTRRGVAE